MIAKISTIAFFASLAAAIHEPVGPEPSGNPISAPLTEIVPACKPYTITWQPTTPNKISIRLLRGPSTNVKPLGAPLVEGLDNKGTFVWTPAADLEADTTHYGLQIIDDVNGQYQYSNQFGISKDACKDAPTTSDPPAKTTKSSEPPASTKPASSTKGYDEPSTTVPAVTSIASTGAPAGNSTTLVGTKSMTVPSSLQTSGTASRGTGPPSTTTSDLPLATGAAAGVRAGLGLAGAVAGLVFML